VLSNPDFRLPKTARCRADGRLTSALVGSRRLEDRTVGGSPALGREVVCSAPLDLVVSVEAASLHARAPNRRWSPRRSRLRDARRRFAHDLTPGRFGSATTAALAHPRRLELELRRRACGDHETSRGGARCHAHPGALPRPVHRNATPQSPPADPRFLIPCPPLFSSAECWSASRAGGGTLQAPQSLTTLCGTGTLCKHGGAWCRSPSPSGWRASALLPALGGRSGARRAGGADGAVPRYPLRQAWSMDGSRRVW
jgi:hypothetical protein